MKKIKDISCWIATEGIAGTENQCLGVAEALGFSPNVIKVTLRQPWKSLSPWLGAECAYTFENDLSPPWPDILISSGRKAISAARYIKHKSGGKTFVTHIQDPRIDPSAFDLVAVPFHDPARGDNVIITDVAPNRITDEKLKTARNSFKNIETLTFPRIAVLIGGKSNAYDMSVEDIERLIVQLKTLQETGNASLMLTASRRTGEKNMQRLKTAFPENAQTLFWDGSGNNPYMAYLAYADYILVTADSVSMISDALATGRPTYVIPLNGGGRRLDLFHQHILERGLVKPFDGTLAPYDYEIVREAEKIAQVIRNKMNLIRE